jgi:serine/threonine protein phosphatase 1
VLKKIKTNPAQDRESSTLPRVDPSDRVYAVGDIHGRYDLFLSLFSKISHDASQIADNRQNRLIFMGDYVDRGDQSFEVIKALNDLFVKREKILKSANFRIEFLMGNHEAAMLDFLEDPERGRAWLQWGGIQTLASFGVSGVGRRATTSDLHRMHDEFSKKILPYLGFFENLSPLIVSGNVVFVHAGLDPDSALNAQQEDITLWGRTASGKPLGFPGYRVVHGHFDDKDPVSTPERICVDTGAYYSGRLTAVRLDERETFLQTGVCPVLPLTEHKFADERDSSVTQIPFMVECICEKTF